MKREGGTWSVERKRAMWQERRRWLALNRDSAKILAPPNDVALWTPLYWWSSPRSLCAPHASCRTPSQLIQTASAGGISLLAAIFCISAVNIVRPTDIHIVQQLNTLIHYAYLLYMPHICTLSVPRSQICTAKLIKSKSTEIMIK